MKYLNIIGVLIVLLLTSGCKKWFDINTDPATPQETKAEYMLPPIIAQMAINTATDYRVIFKYTQNMFAQSLDPIANIAWERHGYVPANDLGGSIWRMNYVNLGPNVELLLQDSEANGKWTYAGIGYAIKAWGYQMTTDAHGPIILDQYYEKDRLSFAYQDQPEVYEKVREWCYKGLACFTKEDVGNYAGVLAGASGDMIYKGDRAKWKKFIYATLALQYSHLVNKPEFATSYADSVIKYVDLSFTNVAEDATVYFEGTTTTTTTFTGNSNPLSQNFALITTTAYGRIGQPIVDYLTGGVRGTPTPNPTTSVDPRLSRMITPTPSGVYRGVMPLLGDQAATKTIPHVLGAVNGTATAPYPGKYIFANAARYPLMTYSQLLFAKAEAQFYKGMLAEAHTTYKDAIKAHVDFTNTYGRNGSPAAPAITPAELNAYLASSEVAQTPGDLTLADIMGQKYIAQWGWAGMEQWTDIRKYHYDPEIFKQFKQLEASQFFDNNGGEKYAYRLRPRYNSEYVWNKNELAKWGGLALDYHTQETWFSMQ